MIDHLFFVVGLLWTVSVVACLVWFTCFAFDDYLRARSRQREVEELDGLYYGGSE